MDGSQKEGSNFLNMLRKEGVPRKGVPSEMAGFQPWRKLCMSDHNRNSNKFKSANKLSAKQEKDKQYLWSKCKYASKGKVYIFSCITEPPAVTGRVLWIGVCPSFRPSSFHLKVCLGLGLESLLRCPCVFVHGRAGFFYKNLFAPKMSQKQGFLNLLEYLVITFFWIWSIKKVYDTCCILAHIPYFGKFWFLRYGSKCCSPIRLHYF